MNTWPKGKPHIPVLHEVAQRFNCHKGRSKALWSVIKSMPNESEDINRVLQQMRIMADELHRLYDEEYRRRREAIVNLRGYPAWRGNTKKKKRESSYD